MKKVTGLIGALCMLSSMSAFAMGPGGPSGLSFAVGGGLLTFDDTQDTLNPIQLVGRFGFDVNEFFGVGGELGVSLIKDSVNNVDFDVTTTFLYLKGMVPLDQDSKLYGMIGPTNTKLTGTASVSGISVSASADDDDTGVGFGYERSFGANGFSVDYIKYNDNQGVDVHSINFTYIIHL